MIMMLTNNCWGLKKWFMIGGPNDYDVNYNLKWNSIMIMMLTYVN